MKFKTLFDEEIRKITSLLNLNKSIDLLRRFQVKTYTELREINICDENLIKSFVKELGNEKPNYLHIFSSEFSRKLLKQLSPNNMHELIIVSGFILSSGTYKNNAEILILENRCHLSDLFTTKEDLIGFLKNHNMSDANLIEEVLNSIKTHSFKKETLNKLESKNLPNWFKNYVTSCCYLPSKSNVLLNLAISLYLFFYRRNYPRVYKEELENYEKNH